MLRLLISDITVVKGPDPNVSGGDEQCIFWRRPSER
jgi:hypothetical protein